MTHLRIAASILLFLFSSSALAQSSLPISFSGQIRHRTEFDARSFDEEADNPLFHLLRTRVGIAAAPLPRTAVFVQVQDARLFGGENPDLARGTMDGDADALDLHQAFFRIEEVFDTPVNLILGRQEMAYGNERLVGAVGWSNIGRSFDAARLSLHTDRLDVDFFGAQLVGSTVTAQSQNLFGIYSTILLTENDALDAFVLLDNNTREIEVGPDQGESFLSRYTPGLYFHGRHDDFDYSAELYYQAGHLTPTPALATFNISAYLVSAGLGYTFLPETGTRIGLTYTRLSGDDDPLDDTSGNFNTLFATNHKFYGYMDFFPGIFPLLGLQDAFVSLGSNLTDRLAINIDAHHFAAAVSHNAEDTQSYGQEIDLTAAYRYNQAFTVSGGSSVFFPGSLMEVAGLDEMAGWLFLMTSVTFQGEDHSTVTLNETALLRTRYAFRVMWSIQGQPAAALWNVRFAA